MTPQLLITLSPSGNLQAELPSPNGGRQILPFIGDPADIIDSMKRILLAQSRGQSKIGTEGRPTAQQLAHQLQHSSPSQGCPFCHLGLLHAAHFCTSPSRKTKKRHLSDVTRATVAAFAPPITEDDLAEFGL